MTTGNGGEDPKEKAEVPPVLPSEQQSSADASGALSPDDLDFTESPHVDEIDDGRYVVSADRSPSTVPEKQKASSQSLPQAQSTSQSQSNTARERAPRTPDSADLKQDAPSPSTGQQFLQSPEAARSLLAEELERVDARFAIDIVSQFDDNTVRHRMTSDDVLGTFNSLVFWYARHVSRNTPTNRAASLLLAKSDFTPELTAKQVRTAMRKHGLDESSSLQELLEALE